MDIEEIRKRKMLEMMRRLNQPTQPESAQEQNISAIGDQYIKEIRSNLDDKAYERLMNVRMINPELYVKAVYMLYQMKMTGRLRGTLDDKKMKSFLISLLPKERETRIIRK